jgi:Uma2 family endonuclease
MTTDVSLERTYTVDEFMHLADDGYSYELVRGRLQPMSPTSGEHGRIAALLHIYLGSYVLQHALGETFVAETAFVLDAATHDVRAADIAFVAAPRLSAIGEGAVPFPPDLAIEVISPTDRLTKVQEKVAQYQRAGVRLVWVLNPRHKTVQVFHSGVQEPTTLDLDGVLDGEDVVPGFTLPVRVLFERR